MNKSILGCVSTCPDGWLDHGLYCALGVYNYGRGAGYTGWRQKVCESENPQGCEMSGWMWYPKCKQGYYAFGCCICTPNQISSAFCKEMFGPSSYVIAGHSCANEIELTGLDPVYAACPPDLEFDAGLCYEKCPEGSSGVGPVCWFAPPEGWTSCGMGAAISEDVCTSISKDQVLSVVMLVLKVATVAATLGSANVVSTATDKISSVISNSDSAVSALGTAYSAMSAADVALLAALLPLPVSGEKTSDIADLTKSDKVEDRIRGAAQIIQYFDPIGIASVVGAYTFPQCG